MPVKLSVLIPVKNEAAHIVGCIQSVAWADEVVVIDSGSTDGTTEAALALGARVVQFAYVPGGPKKKNWALANVDFRNEWILILDADERITPSLAEDIGRAVAGAAPEHAGYYLNRRLFFLGRWIRHAGYFPSWNLRLFRRDAGRYEQIPDFDAANGDNEVHEHVLLRGSAGYLQAPMDHFAYSGIQSFVEKHNRYSTWESQAGRRYLAPEANGGRMALHLRCRRAAKRLARALPFPDFARFAFHYILRGGFLDGVEGYIFCRLLAEYEFLIWAKQSARRTTPA
jgi:glycosyltransferase involved in cell wall biosynthesis